jgi:hypothetical protein
MTKREADNWYSSMIEVMIQLNSTSVPSYVFHVLTGTTLGYSSFHPDDFNVRTQRNFSLIPAFY